jgi:hypothetical protein
VEKRVKLNPDKQKAYEACVAQSDAAAGKLSDASHRVLEINGLLSYAGGEERADLLREKRELNDCLANLPDEIGELRYQEILAQVEMMADGCDVPHFKGIYGEYEDESFQERFNFQRQTGIDYKDHDTWLQFANKEAVSSRDLAVRVRDLYLTGKFGREQVQLDPQVYNDYSGYSSR